MSALKALEKAIQRGTAVVACTSTNIEEIGRRDDELSRLECAQFCVSLSRNYSLKSHVDVQSIEIRNAVTGIAAAQDIRHQLMRWGFGHSFRARRFASEVASPEEIETVNLVLDYPELSVCCVAYLLARDEIQAIQERSQATMDQARAVRALDQKLARKDRLDAELKESYGRIILPPLLRELGLAANALDKDLSTRQQRRKFWLAIPTVDVFLALVLQRDANVYAKTQNNDVNDLGLLQVGIPYANIVATEKFWANMVRQTGIAAKYGCYVTSSLVDVADQLGAQGCL